MNLYEAEKKGIIIPGKDEILSILKNLEEVSGLLRKGLSIRTEVKLKGLIVELSLYVEIFGVQVIGVKRLDGNSWVDKDNKCIPKGRLPDYIQGILLDFSDKLRVVINELEEVSFSIMEDY